MYKDISDSEAAELLFEAIEIQRRIKLTSKSSNQNNLHRFRQIGVKLQNYVHPINDNAIAVNQIPLKIRRCFVKSVMLLTRYPQLGGKQTGGTYKSDIVSSYQHDPIPDCWYQGDMVTRLCRWFQLSSQYAQEIEHLLNKVDLQVARQKQIMQALRNEFNSVSCQKDVLKLFQSLFGDVPLPEKSINCLTTEMQVAFLIDYKEKRLKKERLWQQLSALEQQNILGFLQKISQFSWQQFDRFPSFGYVETADIDSQLLQRLVDSTGYSKSAIVKAIATSVTVVATERAESFLLHDIWGHYWQSILTQFRDNYTYLSQTNHNLNLYSSVERTKATVSLQQLFFYQDGVFKINKLLAKNFCQGLFKKRICSLSTHLIGEMLADINEYKWRSQNYNDRDLLLSTSCLKDFPTKLDLTIQDLDFLYSSLLKTLNQLPLSIQTELINKFQIKEEDGLSSLQKAINNINEVWISEFFNQYFKSYIKLISNLLKLQNLLNKLYTRPHNNTLIPFRDLLILFVGNFYSRDFEQDITALNLALANYFTPCWQLLKNVPLN